MHHGLLHWLDARHIDATAMPNVPTIEAHACKFLLVHY
jgi:hypothetical protein